MSTKRSLEIFLVLILFLSILGFINLKVFSLTTSAIVNVAPTPYNSGYYPQGYIVVTTTGSSTTFNLYLFNPTFVEESVPVYVNSSAYTTVTLQPFSYTTVPISLSTGLYNISVEGQTLYVEVVHSSYQPIITYINGTANVYKLNAQPGKTYSFQISYSSTPSNATEESEVYSDIGFYISPNDQEGVTPYLTPSNTFLLQIPEGIAQGVYYAYVYTSFSNATTGQVVDYSLGLVIINVSYGLPTSLSSPVTVTENGVMLEMENVSGSTLLYIHYPFSYEDIFTLSLPSGTYTVKNYTVSNNVYPPLYTKPNILFYGSTIPMEISPNGIIIEAKAFGTGSIEISSPTGSVTLTIPPKVTMGTLNVEVISSTTGMPIPNAKVSVYYSSNSSLISSSLTSSSGTASFTLPVGEEVKVNVSAFGYYPNSTVVTVSSSSTVKIYLTPIQITVTPTTFTINGSKITPEQVSVGSYKINTTVGNELTLTFSVSINSNVTPSVIAMLNGTSIPVTYEGNGVYEVTHTFSSPGTYEITINTSYDGVWKNFTVTVYVYKPSIITTSTTTTSSTTTTTTSTTHTTVTPVTSSSTTSSTTTTVPPPPTSSTTSSIPLTDIAIIVVVIVIAAVVAIVVLRR
ncbi:hypothetical protein [Sulfurisphaera ohwakuensis]|uniref:Uncharacterized protein n=1 Tax=Sulfurisphaera ohwakuensis TaxID=69656 RepID=A0A650CJH1_SULOH|nr:hypothetical protein [Sulfurisphaera ohwakuensis]MBB5254949.1 hypothetical protein [Sulfurisphaera ohwakuensis]QGR17825.1 hypothetical protein D1869_12050 [Sulfurisphaera ohwakuensis]